MSHYVVTISRQFAAMGRTIGLKMASNLGIELLDRDIVKEAAKRLGLQKGEVSHYDENPGRQSFFLRKTYLFDFSVYSIHNNVFEVQKNIIQDYADKESCIIVGRCADSILRDRKNILNICCSVSPATAGAGRTTKKRSTPARGSRCRTGCAAT